MVLKTTAPRGAWLAAAIGVAILPLASAEASTIDTFSFTQDGYADDGTVTGTFTGTVETDGFIEADDLSAFNANFTATDPVTGGNTEGFFYQTDLQLFSFLPAVDGPNSSLDFYAQTPGLGQNLCVGAAAAFGLCGVSSNAVGVATTIGIGNDSTADLPVLTLISSVNTSPVETPEPAMVPLCGLALVAVGWWRRRALNPAS